jgi:hypothetical protein
MANLGGALALFLLRKEALYLFAGSFALGILSAIHRLPEVWAAIRATPGAAVGMFIGWGILFAICLYTAKLAKGRRPKLASE